MENIWFLMYIGISIHIIVNDYYILYSWRSNILVFQLDGALRWQDYFVLG